MQSSKDIANPNDFDDNNRISKELPLIKEFVEIFVKEELNLPNKFQYS